MTCETAPHYFSLTDDTVRGYNTNAKMTRRSGRGRPAIKEG